jgi:xanthine/CO dehydrogenase XdhC/CoxF family maturation factor
MIEICSKTFERRFLMKEIQDIVKAYDKALSEGKQTALATVVHVEGSSYRRPGARMLVIEDGKLTGAISGGCLEGDALRKALQVMNQQQPMVVTYDTTDEDDAKLGVGLGCNGIIQILIEPIIAEKANNAIRLFKAFLKQRQSAVIVTIFSLEDKRSSEQGTCMLVTSVEIISATNHAHLVNNVLISDAKEALQSNVSLIKNYLPDNKYTAFIEVVQPAVSLVIIGAGNDAIPLVEIANVMGWDVTIVDGRANYATIDRFPALSRVVISKADNILSHFAVDEQTAVVLMTHNYNYDLAALKQLLIAGVKYIGSLGPKKKLQRMLDELQEEGMKISEGHLQTIFGPVGLDIGAETSEEIALSIMAEIKAAFSNRPGTSLRAKQAPIHIPDTAKAIKPFLL